MRGRDVQVRTHTHLVSELQEGEVEFRVDVEHLGLDSSHAVGVRAAADLQLHSSTQKVLVVASAVRHGVKC